MASDEDRARRKDMNRESRLSFRNFAEHQLKQDFRDRALKECDPQIKDFAVCAQEKGLMVIISCRKYHQAVNDCLRLNNGDEAWEKYKAEHQDILDRKAKVIK